MMYCFGVDIGGTTVKIGLFSSEGKVIDKWEIATRTENSGEAILPDIAYSIKEKINAYSLDRENILGIGVGVPAPVMEDGIVGQTVNLGWEYKEVKCELEGLTGFKVKVGNDANVAALGEMWQGGGRGSKNMVMVTLGTGVGGGIIINGEVLIGANGAGGEIGHLFMNEEETEYCGCGKKGCLEQYASATGVVRIAKKKLENYTGDTRLSKEDVTAKDVFDAVKEDDKAAIEVAEEFGRYLGYGMANIATLVDPSIFVIGGGVSKAGEILFDYIKEPYMEKAFFANRNVQFALAELGNDAGIYGAAKLILS